jgi:hypothetical protein
VSYQSMPPLLAKSSSDILIKVGVKKFSSAAALEELDFPRNSPPTILSSKIGEYMVRIGESNEFCFNIIIQLLTQGKVRVDFRDSTERLQLLNKQDLMSRVEAVQVFDRWVKENRSQATQVNKTQRIVLQPPRGKPPRTK